MKYLLIFMLMLLTEAWATGELSPDDPVFETMEDAITEDTVAGRYLTYDCKEGHWVCVVKLDYEECQKKRDEDKRRLKKKLRCAPVGVFLNKKSCFQRQAFMVTQAHGARFCIADQWKQRELD